MRRKNSPVFNETHKYCPHCDKWVLLELFWKRLDNISGRDAYCIECRKEFDKKRYNKVAYRWKRRYGMECWQYDELYKKQDGKCAICGCKQNGKLLAIDHCHKTGKIRGLLCSVCNILLGRFNDDIKVFEKAIKYLQDGQNRYFYEYLMKQEPPPKKLPISNKSGFIGVSWRPEKNKWRAANKKKHIGYFKTKEEAIEAYTNFTKQVA